MHKATLATVIVTIIGVYGCQPKATNAHGPTSPDESAAADQGDVGGADVEEDAAGTTGAAAEPAAATGDEDGVVLQGEWSLAERKTWEQIYADRTQYLNLMNTGCGSSVTMTFDHEAFRDRLPSVDSNRNEDWNASAMITAIRNLCLEGATEKTAVATRIGSIHFVRKPGKKHRLIGKKLQIALDLEANPREYVNDFSAWLQTQI